MTTKAYRLKVWAFATLVAAALFGMAACASQPASSAPSGAGDASPSASAQSADASSAASASAEASSQADEGQAQLLESDEAALTDDESADSAEGADGAEDADSVDGADAVDDAEDSAQAEDAEAAAQAEAEAEAEAEARTEEYNRALFAATGFTTAFIGEPFYDKTIETAEDADAAVDSVLERIGGDDTTTLDLLEIRPTENGTKYYVYRQEAGDAFVHGASVKLVVDKDGKAKGLISAILPNIQLESMDTWAVTQEQAEQAVIDECAANGAKVKVVPGATEQTIIALENNMDQRIFAWLVYTNNYIDDVEASYLAHYVNADGDYLYAIPISEPGNADAEAGDAANFAFDKMEEGTWSGTVTKHDGSTVELEVPTLVNPETGEVVLGDAKRKILCADHADFTYEETLTPRIQKDGKFADKEILVYDTFIRVWDFYDSIGWTGPDGEGTPTLLMMDYVDVDGEPIENACYSGRSWGFQTFSFGGVLGYGECIDVMAHEFTHCLTSTTMTTNLYRNDMGAINEAMSDIMGNLVEMMLDADPEGDWLIGENVGEPRRSMSDPRLYEQPEFAWDIFYGPAVALPSDANDCGGVHSNSSLLNFVSYALDKAGMQVEDQFFFWTNVALALTPSTDYPQIAQLLPWCLEESGYAQYVDALNEAIAKGRFEDTALEPFASLPEGMGTVRIDLAGETPVDLWDIQFNFQATDDTPPLYSGWAIGDSTIAETALPAGEYYARADLYVGELPKDSLYYTEEGWVRASESSEESTPELLSFTIESGKTTTLDTAGLVS